MYPDTGKPNNISPGLGSFPLDNIAEFSRVLPQHMVEKGGLFLAMYQWETRASGGRKTRSLYATSHGPWLDGVATGPGMVKQFVAVRLFGRDHTRELGLPLHFQITMTNLNLRVAPTSGDMQIFVKTLVGETLAVWAESYDIVRERSVTEGNLKSAKSFPATVPNGVDSRVNSGTGGRELCTDAKREFRRRRDDQTNDQRRPQQPVYLGRRED
ncbi:hypothetical protein M405DRAFT_846143 [Rhizopogon salebrosus TDB-379]|nr:hypothetical protein M405DRAFT_846708 [Rhizopogon salebrosus TDB-379]KAJ8582945.1 hypothetical protein M405DRAFT_846143 [Rhizopogon salebrosus TDB-379]